MLAQLTQLLMQKGLAATAEEVADLLWLAGYLDPVVEPEKISTPADQPTTAAGHQDQPAAPTVDPSAASTRRTTRTGQSTRRTEVYATQGTSESEEEKQAARPVRLPAAPALPGALEISRSLRPLMRRIPSRTRFLLDEINTAQRIADTDDWTPLLRPEPTRWLDVALVVDESASMSMWQRTVIEFYHLLERLGAFRQITLWGVTTSPDGTRMHLHTGIGIAPERIRSRDPRELLDPNNQRLIVVVSDCVSPAWHNNNWPALLVTWGREGLVTLIQMLPPFFWRRTGLRHFPAVLLQTQRAGAPNQDLAAWSLPRRGQAEPTGIAIPVTTLDPKRLVAWARTIAGDNRIRLPGFMLPPDLEPPSFTPVTTPAPATANSAPSAEQVLATFHTTASPLARQLAGHLAALSSLSLPLIHLVQQVMVKEARQTDLAEVMLSGLIRRVTPRDRFDLPADQIEYQFLNEAVREQLRSTIRISEGDAVHNLVEKLSHYLEARLGQWNDFSAYIVDSTGDYQIARGHQVMARLRLTSLQQALITPATQNADEIVASADSGQGDGRQQPNQSLELYALLVGINQYSHFSPGLQGCVNDTQAMSEVLQAKFGIPATNLSRLVDQQATHSAIQAAWQRLVEQVKAWADGGRQGAPPIVLFHFSGYGQENLLFAYDSEPDRDHFIEKQHIETWLRALNEYGTETVLILDTCGTSKHIGPHNEADGWRFEQPATVWVAAQKDEGAHEQQIGESTFGLFTYLLVSELERLSLDEANQLTYTDLHSRISQRLQALSLRQSPRLLGAGQRLLFGGLAPKSERFFHLTQVGDVLRLDGGLLQGLTKGTRLNVYPAARTHDDAASALGKVHLVECRALSSECLLAPGLHSNGAIPTTAVALVEPYSFQRFVYLTVENETLRDTLLYALTVSPPMAEMEALPNYIQVVDQADAADFIIKNVGESFELLERHGNRPIATYSAEQISQLCADLMHLIPYYNHLESYNKTPASDLRVTLAIKELSFEPTTQAPVGRDLPRKVGGEVLVVQGTRIIFEITNHSAQPLYVTLLGFAYDWSIARLYPDNVDANEAVNAGKTLAIGLSSKRAEQFTLHVPNGLQERQDRFKVIATTIPVDFTHFLQEGLPSISSSQRSYFRSMQSDIDLLLLSPSSFHNSGQSITNDWTTAEITVRTVPQGYSEQPTTQLTLDESFYTRYQTYVNFDLLIVRSGHDYQVRVIRSPVGETTSLFSIEAEQFLHKYETSLQPLSNNLTEIQKLGAQLFDALFRNEVLVLLRESMAVAASHNRGLRIHLRFSETPELTSLPWEYLYDQASGRFLALSNATLLVRFLELPPNQPRRAVAQPLKILVVLASPQDSVPLELEAEWQKLQSAMHTQVERGIVVLTRLEKATISALQQQLRQDEYHIFHFAGHGYASSARNEGFLLFEDEERRTHSISSSQLGVLLRSSSSLRLVVLNTSDSAPMAYRLCEQGIMAVVGLQNSFSDVDSIQLTNTFYGSLATGESVDIALATTRRVLYLAGDSSAWGTPVLVSASSDNRLFSLPRRGLRIDPQTSTVWVDGRIVEALTPREFDLLVCLAEEPGKIYETETILTNLYPHGEQITVESGYVAALVYRVRAKIERDPSNPQYLLNVRGRGYRLLMEAE